MLRSAFQKLVGIFIFAAVFAAAGPAEAVTGNVTMVNDVAQTGGFTLELTDEATGESIGTFTDVDGDGTVEVAVDDEDAKKCVVATIKNRVGNVIRYIPCFIIPLWDGFSLNVDITPGRVTTVSGGPPIQLKHGLPRRVGTTPAMAQSEYWRTSDNYRIRVDVRESDGTRVRGATVTVENLETGESQSAQTGVIMSGEANFALLAAGLYRVTVDGNGRFGTRYVLLGAVDDARAQHGYAIQFEGRVFFELDTLPTSPGPIDGVIPALTRAGLTAVSEGDTKTYEEVLAELERLVTMHQRADRQLGAVIDSFIEHWLPPGIRDRVKDLLADAKTPEAKLAVVKDAIEELWQQKMQAAEMGAPITEETEALLAALVRLSKLLDTRVKHRVWQRAAIDATEKIKGAKRDRVTIGLRPTEGAPPPLIGRGEAAPTTTSVTVTVRTADGEGVENVLIQLTNLETGAVYRVDTGADGRASFPDVPAGPYKIFAGTELKGQTRVYDRVGTDYKRFADGKPGSYTFVFDEFRDSWGGTFIQAREALESGDTAAYQQAVAEMDRERQVVEVDRIQLSKVFDDTEQTLLSQLPVGVRSKFEANTGDDDSVAGRLAAAWTTRAQVKQDIQAARNMGMPVSGGLGDRGLETLERLTDLYNESIQIDNLLEVLQEFLDAVKSAAASRRQAAAPPPLERAEAAPATTSVTVTIRTADGEGVDGAGVIITNLETGQEYTAGTGEFGEAGFGAVPAGPYRIEVFLGSFLEEDVTTIRGYKSFAAGKRGYYTFVTDEIPVGDPASLRDQALRALESGDTAAYQEAVAGLDRIRLRDEAVLYQFSKVIQEQEQGYLSQLPDNIRRRFDANTGGDDSGAARRAAAVKTRDQIHGEVLRAAGMGFPVTKEANDALRTLFRLTNLYGEAIEVEVEMRDAQEALDSVESAAASQRQAAAPSRNAGDRWTRVDHRIRVDPRIFTNGILGDVGYGRSYRSDGYKNAPLFQNNNATGQNLLDFDRDTSGPVLGISGYANWVLKDMNLYAGLEGSTAERSQSRNQVTVQNPFIAQIFAVDGSNSFNLDNNLNNVQLDLDRYSVGAKVGAVFPYRFGRFNIVIRPEIRYRFESQQTDLSFQDGGVNNRIETDLYSHNLEGLINIGSHLALSRSLDLSVNLEGGVGAIFSDLDAQQTRGNQIFDAGEYAIHLAIILGGGFRLDFRPFGDRGISIGPYLDVRYWGDVPHERFPTQLGQSIEVDYGSRTEFAGGISIRFPVPAPF